MFQNPEISLDELPAVEDVDWQPMHASLLTQILIQQLIAFTAITVVSLLVRFFGNVTFLPAWLHILALLVLLGVFIGWPVIAVRRRAVAFRERDVLYRSGVVTHRVTAIPFNRIQHVETTQGPLARQFGTSSLQIYTAGGSKGDLGIEGLETGLAERLRRMILERIGSSVEQN